MLVKTIMSAGELKEEFIAWDRDYFSYEACKAIIELFEETGCGQPQELDIVGLCGNFNEESAEYIKNNYNNIDEIAEAESIDELLDALNYYTWAIQTNDNDILYITF